MPTRKIETEITLGGEREFNDAMKACNSNLKTLRSDMTAVSSEFRKNENSTRALTEKQKILKEQLAQEKEVVRALQERYEKVKEQYGENSAEADKYKQKLNAATAAMNKTSDAVKENRKHLAQHVLLLDKNKDAYGKLGKVVSTFESGAKESFSAVAKAAGVLSTVGVGVVGALGTMAVSGLDTLTGFATDAATRSKDAYDRANELAAQAREAILAGNEEAGMAYLAEANQLIDTIDAEYLQLGFALDGLQTASTAAKDALGKILLPALTDLSTEGGALLQSFADEMEAASGDTEKMGEIIAKYVTEAVALLREQLPVFLALGKELITGLGTGLVENLPEILEDAGAILDTILDALEEGAPALGDAAALLITSLAGFIVEHAPELLSSGIEFVTQLINGLVGAVPDLLAKIPELVTSLLGALVEHAPELAAGGLQLIGQIAVGLVNAIPTILTEMANLPAKLFNAFATSEVDFSTIGKNIIAGIRSGVAEVWDNFTGWLTDGFGGLVGGIKDFLGIHSPSTVFRDQIGANMAAGVGVGFEKEMANVKRSVNNSMDELLEEQEGGMGFHVSAYPAEGGSRVENRFGGIVININGYEAQNDEQLGEIIAYKLQEFLARRGA